MSLMSFFQRSLQPKLVLSGFVTVSSFTTLYQKYADVLFSSPFLLEQVIDLFLYIFSRV